MSCKSGENKGESVKSDPEHEKLAAYIYGPKTKGWQKFPQKCNTEDAAGWRSDSSLSHVGKNRHAMPKRRASEGSIGDQHQTDTAGQVCCCCTADDRAAGAVKENVPRTDGPIRVTGALHLSGTASWMKPPLLPEEEFSEDSKDKGSNDEKDENGTTYSSDRSGRKGNGKPESIGEPTYGCETFSFFDQAPCEHSAMIEELEAEIDDLKSLRLTDQYTVRDYRLETESLLAEMNELRARKATALDRVAELEFMHQYHLTYGAYLRSELGKARGAALENSSSGATRVRRLSSDLTCIRSRLKESLFMVHKTSSSRPFSLPLCQSVWR